MRIILSPAKKMNVDTDRLEMQAKAAMMVVSTQKRHCGALENEENK